jgi:hypothetical protein
MKVRDFIRPESPPAATPVRGPFRSAIAASSRARILKSDGLNFLPMMVSVDQVVSGVIGETFCGAEP